MVAQDLSEALMKVAQTGSGTADLVRGLGAFIDDKWRGKKEVEPQKRMRAKGETTMALLLDAADKRDAEHEEVLVHVYGDGNKQKLVDALVDKDSAKNMPALEKSCASLCS